MPTLSTDSTPDARRSAQLMRTALLDWFSSNARDLPWRRARDPWRVWVSEVMLQQTRVEAVVEPYARFLEAFPTLETMAVADEADVLARWSGLGYYRRARLLHSGARYVAEQHSGKVPSTRAELERVPGVGAYTAGAILAIAFGQSVPAVDANVSRVVARLRAIGDSHSVEGRREIGHYASLLVDCDQPGNVNEALMDLGSALCTARVARCEQCPLADLCGGRAAGSPEAIGAPVPRTPPRLVELACAVVTAGDRVLFLQRPDKSALMAGLWDLPTVDFSQASTSSGLEGQSTAIEEELRATVRDRCGLDVEMRDSAVEVRHAIVGRKIVAKVYSATVPAREVADLPADARFLAELEFPKVGLPSLPIKILRALGRCEPRRSHEVPEAK